jgi:hypothetical protein
VWGGETPKGFDCSGFVQYVYRAEGVELPRTSRQMAGSGFAVSRNEMAIGDLMLFADSGEPISHVAIYAGQWAFHPLVIERQRRPVRRPQFRPGCLVQAESRCSSPRRDGLGFRRHRIREEPDSIRGIRSAGQGASRQEMTDCIVGP